jgi:hypothetical protein
MPILNAIIAMITSWPWDIGHLRAAEPLVEFIQTILGCSAVKRKPGLLRMRQHAKIHAEASHSCRLTERSNAVRGDFSSHWRYKELMQPVPALANHHHYPVNRHAPIHA